MSKPTKTAEQYSHDIKLLKYYLEEAIKENNTLKYRLRQVEREKKAAAKSAGKEHTVKTYRTDEVAKKIYRLLRDRGIPLSAVFRMADAEYAKEISNEALMAVFTKLRVGVTEQEILQVVFAMDCSLNGKIDEAEYKTFVNTYGVGDDTTETFRLEELATQKFVRFLKERQLSATKLFEEIDSDGSQTIDANELRMYFKEYKAKLNENEIFLLLNHLDPQKKGSISKKTFESFIGTASKKEQTTKANDEFEKEIKKLAEKMKEAKINPIELFEEADTDKMGGVTTAELEAALKKAFPKESQLQIKKWVGHINYNGDKVIDREEFLAAISAVYTPDDVKKFGSNYASKKSKQAEEKLSKEAVDKLIQQLSEKIEDSGLKKKEVFMAMDKSGDGKIDRNELVLGLKSFGLHVALVNNLLKVFDKDGTNSIDMNEFLKILGEDVDISDVDMPNEPLKAKEDNKKPKPQQKDDPKEKLKEKPKDQSKRQISKKDSKIQQKPPIRSPSPSPQPKPVVKKESKNPANEVKPTSKIAKKQTKEAPKKTFEEDEIFSDHERPEPPRTPEKEYLSEEQLAPHLEKLSGLYRKNKDKALAFFTKYDKKNIAYVNEANFKTVMKQMLGFSESIKEQLVVDSLYNYAQIDEAVNYKLWLDEIAENYKAVNVEAQQPIVKKDSKPPEKTSTIKRDPSVKKEDLKLDSNKPGQKKNEPPIARTDSTTVPAERKISKKQSKSEASVEKKPAQKAVQKTAEKPDTANIIGSILNPPTGSQRSIESKKRGEEIAQFLVLIAEEANKPDTDTLKQGKATMLNYIQFDELQLQEFYVEAKKLKDKKSRYADKSFPPERNSIARNLGKLDVNVTALQWEHISKLYKKPEMFKNSADPNDIHQGLLGNCYLLSSLSSIAEYPQLAERLVEYEDNECGMYGIWLCIDGEWQLIIVDGWLVVRSADKRVAFSSSDQEELWVSIIEKAYAKAFGSFQNINGGRTYEAIRDLTGAPGKRYEHTDEHNEQVHEDELWKILVDSDKKQYIMTAGTDLSRKGVKKEGHAEDVTDTGIALGHAYSILDVREIRNERIIKLRNPWGKTEWKGDWSDKSDKWTKELREDLKADDADDGIFWMPFSNFYWEEFQVTCVNFIRPTYFYRTIRPAKGVLEFVVRCEPFSHGYITLSQRDLRHTGESDNTKYSRVSIATFGMKQDKVTHFYNNQGFGGRRDACIELNPKAGEDPAVYVVVDQQCQFNVNYYGKENIKLKFQRAEDVLDKLLMTMVPKDGFLPYKDFSYFLNNFGRYFFICARNNHATRSGKFKVDMAKSEGIDIMVPQKKGSQSFTVALEPGQIKVVKYRITGKMGYGIEAYSISASLD